MQDEFRPSSFPPRLSFEAEGGSLFHDFRELGTFAAVFPIFLKRHALFWVQLNELLVVFRMNS